MTFHKVQKCLPTAKILAYSRDDGLFIPETDVSQVHIGAVLSQVQHRKRTVTSFFSRKLSKGERNYCITRRVLLTVVKVVESFHSFL